MSTGSVKRLLLVGNCGAEEGTTGAGSRLAIAEVTVRGELCKVMLNFQIEIFHAEQAPSTESQLIHAVQLLLGSPLRRK